eukprot:COSAG01_NODE_108_length_25947_cov_25.489593_23_plen_107_part_00
MGTVPKSISRKSHRLRSEALLPYAARVRKQRIHVSSDEKKREQQISFMPAGPYISHGCAAARLRLLWPNCVTAAAQPQPRDPTSRAARQRLQRAAAGCAAAVPVLF